MDYFDSEISHLIVKKSGSGICNYDIKSTITKEELPKTYNRIVPDRYFYSNSVDICSFLRGLYSANGSVVDNRITLKTTSYKLLERVQIMLSSLGICSYFTTNRSKMNKFANGEYECKQSYDLNIISDRNVFFDKIGFIQKYKMQKLANVINVIKHSNFRKKTYDIISVEFISEEEVFDITVDNIPHTYWTGGVNVSNCAEILLRSKQLCNLSSVICRSHDDKESLKRKIILATILGTFQSTLTEFRYLSKDWSKNTRDERLLGVSLNGILDCPLIYKEENVEFVRELRQLVVDTNKEWADILGIEESTATTCVKPEGCTTLDTKVKTTEGIKTVKEIYDLCEESDDIWLDLTRPIYVYDENNDVKLITKFFINGMSEVYEIVDELGNSYKFTGEHKLKTANGWKKVRDLTVDDDIISF